MLPEPFAGPQTDVRTGDLARVRTQRQRGPRRRARGAARPRSRAAGRRLARRLLRPGPPPLGLHPRRRAGGARARLSSRSTPPRSKRSTCDATAASTRGSARSTWCRSCRSAARRWRDAVDGAAPLAAEVGAPLRAAGLPLRGGGDARRAPRAARAPPRRVRGLRARRSRAPAGRPTSGPRRSIPTAGVAVVGARFFLVAFNVVLDADDLALARAVARSRPRLRRRAAGGARARRLPRQRAARRR